MTKRVRYWVLKCPLSGYFKAMAGIGPACTPALDEAHRFRTRKAAEQHPAFFFALTFFKAEPVR